MKYIPGSFSHLFSLFYGSQVLSSLPLLSWLVNSRGIKQKSRFSSYYFTIWNICPFFRVYEDKARLIWVTGLGNFGGENKNIVSPSPDQIYMYRLPVLILHPLETPPPQNVFSDWKIPFIAQKRLFVCTRSTRISMEYQCVCLHSSSGFI